ncbi:MAG: PQQ-dependent sugar dehydrogenase [Opitutaceae bacterium]|nr:PQQ-dependent sugar dehydrogenase [Opitutaceae bacterium]
MPPTLRPTFPALVILAAALAPAGLLFGQNPRPTGKANEAYAQQCANCHGKKLEGGQTPAGNKVPSLLDDEWLHGGDDESIARSIRNGYPEKEMPVWSATMPEKEIRAMVIYIREQRALFQRGLIQFNKPQDSVTVKGELHDYQLNTWVGEVTEPWSLAFLPGHRAIMTEKRGNVFLIENGKRAEKPLTGVPPVESTGQAGLYDVVPHPDFARNGWLYFAFADPQKYEGKAVCLTKVIRGKIRDGALVDQETIYQAPLAKYPKSGGPHFGGRIAFDQNGHVFFSIGERGNGANAQDLSVPMGKVHRVFDDGRVPDDNPFAKDPKAVPTIWSYGHRNPQGLAFHPVTGQLFDAEHGPRGGDELNLVGKGKNYGWPVITYGMNYDGSAMTDITAKEGMEQPVTYWTPSLAVCGMNFYSGNLFPKWKNQLFLASLVGEELRRIEIKDGKVVAQEILFKNLGRIRHVIGGPDGALYVLLPTRIARIAPAAGPSS